MEILKRNVQFEIHTYIYRGSNKTNSMIKLQLIGNYMQTKKGQRKIFLRKKKTSKTVHMAQLYISNYNRNHNLAARDATYYSWRTHIKLNTNTNFFPGKELAVDQLLVYPQESNIGFFQKVYCTTLSRKMAINLAVNHCRHGRTFASLHECGAESNGVN